MAKLDKAVVIREPVGADGRGPFAPVLNERQRVSQSLQAIWMTGIREWPMRRRQRGTPLIEALYETQTEAAKKILKAALISRAQEHESNFVISDLKITSELSTAGTTIQIDVYGVLKKTGESTTFGFVIQVP